MAFCTKEEIILLKDIEKLIRKKGLMENSHPFHAESIANSYRNGQINAKPRTKRNTSAYGRSSQSKKTYLRKPKSLKKKIFKKASRFYQPEKF